MPTRTLSDRRSVHETGRRPGIVLQMPAGAGLVGFPQAFEAQVRASPSAIAAVFEGQHVSYATLNARANQLARHLRALGLRPGQRVGICVERSIEMLVAMLAALKAGAAYVPLDPAYPENLIAYMVDDASLSLVLADSTQPSGFFASVAQVVRLDEDRAAIWAQGDADLGLPIAEEDIAYILYTSGSTGRPKGVELHHGGLMAFLRAMVEEPGLTAQDVVVGITTISFDISVLELLLPLLVGARTVVASRADAIDGHRLARVLADSGGTVLQVTPATWRLLLATGWQGMPGLKALCGGEAMTRDLADALLARCGELWNMYGPTEATVWSTVQRVAPGTGPVPVGRPIRGTYVRVLESAEDGALRAVADGEVGEIYIGGAGVARGYLDRPDLTAERFIPDPFGTEPGARLYRTGDLGHQDKDGVLYCLGRVDHQVKIRGHRMELGEVEAAILSHPSVHAAVAAARDDAMGEAQLVAYFVPELAPGDTAAEAALVAGLRQELEVALPPQMIPTRLVVMDALPLTPNGKIDRQALPEPSSIAALTVGLVAPRSVVEHELVAIWREVLGLEGIGIRHDFFEIGGHSLQVARMVGRIKEAFSCDLPLATIFEARTVEALAQRIEAARGRPASVDANPALVRFRDGDGTPPLFLAIAMDEDVEIYLNLSRHIDDGRPVYGLRTTDAEGRAIPFARLRDMAAYLVAQVRSVQPEGPYLLGGQCAGGIVAFEMAQQMQRSGLDVALVALLDAADAQARRVRSEQVPAPRRTLRSRAIDGMIWLHSSLEAKSIALPRFLGKRRSVRNPGRLLAYAIRHHAPKGVFDGKVVLLRASASDGRPSDVPYVEQYLDPLLGWGRRVAGGGIEVHDVPGGHGSMLEEPHVGASGKAICGAIAEAMQRAMRSCDSRGLPLSPPPAGD